MPATPPNPLATMTIIHALWNNQPSFKLIPIESFCPYTEVIFDPTDRSMGVVSKEHKPKLMMLAKVDEDGDAIPRKAIKGKKLNIDEPYQLGRVQVDAFYEYFLASETDIVALVLRLAENPDHEAFRHFYPVAAAPAVPAYTLGREAQAEPSFQSEVSSNELIAARMRSRIGEVSLLVAPDAPAGPYASAVITPETATMALSDDEPENIAYRQAA